MRVKPSPSATFAIARALLGVGAWLTLVVACGGPLPGGDGTPPKVVSTVPADGATGVALNRSVVITFSEPMDRAKTQAAIVWTPDLDCGFTWSTDSTRLTCQPQPAHQADTQYDITVAVSATDVAGVPLAAAYRFSYTTSAEVLSACVFGSVEARFGSCVFGP